MSASLVGSEMCIRDRALQANCSFGGDGGGAGEGGFQGGRGNQQGRKAVSYTHLTLPTICSV
eukprot:5754832-Alexandrium_andersonii.AAC.1